MPPKGELDIPQVVLDARSGREILRIWIADGSPAISARTADHDAAEWGFLLHEMYAHAMLALHQAHGGDAEELVEAFLESFATALGVHVDPKEGD